jgi:hypothetical protein
MFVVNDSLSGTGRWPCTTISKRLVKAKILQLVARIGSEGAAGSTMNELRLMLRSLKQPRMPGISVFPQLYVMSVSEREGTYKTTLDPYLETELVGPSVGDAVFDAMRTVLEESYGLSVEVSGKYKWKIVRGDFKAGDLSYDEERGQRVRRLRATLAGRTIAFCYRPFGLVVETRIHFNPSAKRRQIRSEVLPTLRRKEEEFIRMLTARPSQFLGYAERVLMSTS